MARAKVIAGHEKLSKPVYSILVDGEEITMKYGVYSVMVNKTVNRIPTAEVVLYDGSPSKQDFKLSSDGIFDPSASKVITINASYKTDADTSTKKIFSGIIILGAFSKS